MVNEFESENWDGPPPAGSPAGVTTAGQAYLMARGFHTGSQWILLGIVVWGVGSTLLNMFLFSVAASYLQQDGEGEVVLKPSEGEQAAVHCSSLAATAAHRGHSAPHKPLTRLCPLQMS